MRTSLFIFRACAIAAAIAGCGGSGGDDGAAAGEFDDRQIVTDFADEVVVPTYALLAKRLGALDDAAHALAEDPTSETLDAARQAWVAARKPWEQSEGFLFGPVDTFGYDPAMDSWPVNVTDLDAVLDSTEAFTAKYVGSLQETQKGFHTIEYLIFGVDKAQAEGALTARDIEYLTALTAELSGVGAALATSWTESKDERPAYRDVFAAAGETDSSAYPSLSAAVQEILGGMIGICDEVANGKLADPYDAHDDTLVESQFSGNSLTDFQDNLRSVQNAYRGGVPGANTSGRGLADYVAEFEPDLDARVQREIEDAIDAIGAIPAPFGKAIVTSSAYDEIEAAQQAVRTLQQTFERDVQPLVLR